MRNGSFNTSMLVIALAQSIYDAVMLPSGSVLGACVQPMLNLVVCPHKAFAGAGGDSYSTPKISNLSYCVTCSILFELRFLLATRGVDIGNAIAAIGSLITSLPPATVF